MLNKLKLLTNKTVAALSLIALVVFASPASASNVSYIPPEDDYLQELAQFLDNGASDLTIYVDETPTYTPSTTDTYAMIEPGTERQEIVIIDSYDANAGTLTVAGGGRGQDLYLGDSRTTKRFEHPAGSQIIITDNYLFWQGIQTAVNSKLDNDGGNGDTDFDLDLPGSNFRIRKDGNDMKFTDDNHSEITLSTLASAAGADELLKVSNNDTTAGYLNGKAVAGDGIDLTENNNGANETLSWVVDVADIIDTAYGLIVSGGNLRINLASQSGLEFNAGALQVDVVPGGGITRDASGLYLSSVFSPTTTYVASEAITTDDAVCLLPVETQKYTQLTDTNLSLGNANSTRRYAVRFVPTVTSSTLTTMRFRAAEQVNGATTLGNLTISIQPDSAGQPSGTAITNGTANVISQATQRTWNTTQADRTATWASSPTLTAGTTYWMVWEVAATSAANYLNISVNSAHDENFITFTRLAYDLDTATWGNSTTNATPWFWFNTQPNLLGFGLVQCDANWGGRTWSYVGFAMAGGAAGSSIAVYYETVPDLASLTTATDYYLSTTPGAITNTAPSGVYVNATEPTQNAYKIGKATSSTVLEVDLGKKEIIGFATNTATTVYQYIFWFKPKRIVFDGSLEGSSDTEFVTSSGVYDGTNNYSSYVNHIDSSAGDLVNIDTTTNFSTNDIGGDNFYGIGSDVNDIGFVNTVTRENSGAGYTYKFIAEL